MRVVTNDALIKRNRTVSQISFFLAIGGLVFSFFFSNRLTSSESGSALYFNCMIIPLLFGLVIFSVRMANNWVREPLAWTSLQKALKGLSSNAVLYHFIMPARHVLICPQGVYVLFPLFHDRPIIVRDDKWRMPGGLLTALISFMRQENIGNPTADAQVEARRLQKFLDKIVPDSGVTVNPLIVFTNPKARVAIEGEQNVPIVFTDAKEQTGLRDYLKSQRDAGHETLDQAQIDQLDAVLLYV
jgi:hypothetical protein